MGVICMELRPYVVSWDTHPVNGLLTNTIIIIIIIIITIAISTCMARS